MKKTSKKVAVLVICLREKRYLCRRIAQAAATDAIEALYIFFGVGQNNAPRRSQPVLEPQ